jgi:hypothetical protein
MRSGRLDPNILSRSMCFMLKRNLMLTAQQLILSQSATSNTLAWLRE